MSKQIEAMKLALEALESYKGFIDDAHILEGQWHWIDGVDNAQVALREALMSGTDGAEQPVQIESLADIGAAYEGIYAEQKAELAKALAEQPAQQEPSWEHHAKKLTRWLHCMSHNDSYFGEPSGLVKQVAGELNRLIGATPQAQPAQQEPVAVVKKVGVTEAVVTLMWGVKEGDKFYTTPQAQPAREPLTEWQPIETAQKHGEICVAEEFTPGRWTFNHAWWNQETEEWQDEYGDFVLTPTLWMPLPCAHGITKGGAA